MSFREKSAWACLAATLVVYVPYFGAIGRLAASGEGSVAEVLAWFGLSSVAAVAVNALLHAAVALSSRDEPRDERDAAVEAAALRVSYFTLAVASFVAFMALSAWAAAAALDAGTAGAAATVGGAGRPSVGLALALAGQALFLCFVLAEGVRFAGLAVGYRRLA